MIYVVLQIPDRPPLHKASSAPWRLWVGVGLPVEGRRGPRGLSVFHHLGPLDVISLRRRPGEQKTRGAAGESGAARQQLVWRSAGWVFHWAEGGATMISCLLSLLSFPPLKSAVLITTVQELKIQYECTMMFMILP